MNNNFQKLFEIDIISDQIVIYGSYIYVYVGQ